MNYFWELDIAASVLSLVLFVVLFLRKSYPTLSRRIFKTLVVFNFLSATMEILMLMVVSEKIKVPFVISNIIVILYYCIHVTLHYIFLLYVITSFRNKIGTKPEKIVLSTIYCLVVLFICTNPFHHLVFDLNSEIFYGKLFELIEVFGVFSIIYAFILTVINKKKLPTLQLSLDIFFLFAWLLSMVLETVFFYIPFKDIDGIFLENFMITTTFSMLTIITDNPSKYFYYTTKVYNEDTFMMVYGEKFKKNIPFKIVAFAYEDFDLYIQKVGKRRAAVAIDETLEHCRKDYGQNNVFGLARNVVVIDARVFKNVELECEKIAEQCYKGGLAANPDCKLNAKFAMFNCPQDCENISDLHTAIYMMLFGDKMLSENRVTYFDKKYLDTRHRKEKIILKLHDAIENDGFEIHYQPLYNWKKDKHVGLEALIRFKQNPDEEYISPGEFIPIAEDEGLIFTIDEIVFEKVCRFCRNVDIKKYGIEFVDINLSLLKLLDGTTVDRYAELAYRYDIDPSFINLEITETAEGDEKYLKTVRANIARFREKGFNFSLDDYGSGYSTVIYMAEMDTKLVKIDATILWNAMKNKKYYTVLENCVRLIYCFDKECLVEGVETEDMTKVLQRLGVDYFQGYYYCKPINEEEILKFLSEKNKIGGR